MRELEVCREKTVACAKDRSDLLELTQGVQGAWKAVLEQTRALHEKELELERERTQLQRDRADEAERRLAEALTRPRRSLKCLFLWKCGERTPDFSRP